MNFYRSLLVLMGALALTACTMASPPTPAAPAPATTGATIQISDPWARAMKMEGGAMGGMEQPTMAPASSDGYGYGGMEPTKAPESGMAHGGTGHGDMDMGGANSAAYMVIRNTGNEPDKLIAASTDVAKIVELHTVVEEGGMMRMRQVEGGIDVPANGEVVLKPGGFHVMLIGLTRDLNAGDSVQLTLTFEKAGQIPVTAQVRQP